MEGKYKLTYFPVYGLVEPIRLCLAYNKVAFEDNRVTFEDWPKLKESGAAPFNQLPFLEIDGKKYAQSGAILKYLCEKIRSTPN